MSKIYQNVLLGDILEQRQETPNEQALFKGEIPIISKISFLDGKIEYRTDKESKTQLILIKPGDLVLSGINAAKGAIAIHDEKSLFLLAATIHYTSYIPKKDRVDIRYLWWLLRSQSFRNLLNMYLPGGVKTELRAKYFLPIPIPLPPLEEQRRIVARIEELAAKIEEARGLRREAVEERDQFNRMILQKLFYDLYECEVTSLENVCSSIIDNLHSNPVYADSGVTCVRSPDVGWGKLHLASALKTTEEEYYRRTVRSEPQKDDIIFVREGGGTGKAAIVEEDQRFSLGQRVMMFRPDKSKVLPKFFLYQMLSPLIYEEQVVPQCKGSASPHINIGVLRNFSFILPSIDKQQDLVNKIDKLQLWIKNLEKKQKEVDIELDALLPSILDKAFKGEL